jgi:hypothetical protein
MKIKILQTLADAIINTIQNMPDSPIRDQMFVFGAQLNAYAIVFHDTYLK